MLETHERMGGVSLMRETVSGCREGLAKKQDKMMGRYQRPAPRFTAAYGSSGLSARYLEEGDDEDADFGDDDTLVRPQQGLREVTPDAPWTLPSSRKLRTAPCSTPGNKSPNKRQPLGPGVPQESKASANVG